MAQRKFQIGDRVRIVGIIKRFAGVPGFRVGHIGRIVNYEKVSSSDILNYQVVRKYKGQRLYLWFSAKEIEKAEI